MVANGPCASSGCWRSTGNTGAPETPISATSRRPRTLRPLDDGRARAALPDRSWVESLRAGGIRRSQTRPRDFRARIPARDSDSLARRQRARALTGWLAARRDRVLIRGSSPLFSQELYRIPLRAPVSERVLPLVERWMPKAKFVAWCKPGSGCKTDSAASEVRTAVRGAPGDAVRIAFFRIDERDLRIDLIRWLRKVGTDRRGRWAPEAHCRLEPIEEDGLVLGNAVQCRAHALAFREHSACLSRIERGMETAGQILKATEVCSGSLACRRDWRWRSSL